MTEKVILASVLNTGKKWNEKPIIEIILSDGRKGSSMDENILKHIAGEEVELDIKDGKEYQGVKQYYFNLPKKSDGKLFPKKDYAFEKRRVALECASRIGIGTSVNEVINQAEILLTWLNKYQ